MEHIHGEVLKHQRCHLLLLLDRVQLETIQACQARLDGIKAQFDILAEFGAADCEYKEQLFELLNNFDEEEQERSKHAKQDEVSELAEASFVFELCLVVIALSELHADEAAVRDEEWSDKC